MDIEWSAHRFSGGMLAFDLANTVIYREDPRRRDDRLVHTDQINTFAVAAIQFNSDRIGEKKATSAISAEEFTKIIALRECVDTYFRARVRKAGDGLFGLSNLLLALADAVKVNNANAFHTQVALSALRLLGEEQASRTRICPNCHWLVFDKSKNGSRVWCDMAVCGNRHKARLNYQRRLKIVGLETSQT